MLKISEFARLARLSPHTLRYYDKIGLLSPQMIDTQNGYRYYKLHQLADLNQIMTLQDSGFSLERIRELRQTPPGDDELHQHLTACEAQLKAQLQDDITRLKRLQSRIQQLEQTMPVPNIVLKTIDAYAYCSTGYICEPDAKIGYLAAEIYTTLEAQKLLATPISHIVVHGASTPESKHQVEIGYPVRNTSPELLMIPDGTALTRRQLPAIPKAATLIYQGARATIQNAYEAMSRWLTDNQYGVQSYVREIHLKPGKNAHDDTSIVELVVPVQSLLTLEPL